MNGRKKTVIWGLGLALTLLAGPAFSQPIPWEAAAQEKAVAAAEQWLALVDQGKYEESWSEAAAYFQGAVTREQWVQSMNGFRKPLGNLLERKFKSARFTASVPGAPDGKYVVIEFETSFENKKTAVETITPMLDKVGQWRVSGYYIK
jgi:hypothetical protein